MWMKLSTSDVSRDDRCDLCLCHCSLFLIARHTNKCVLTTMHPSSIGGSSACCGLDSGSPSLPIQTLKSIRATLFRTAQHCPGPDIGSSRLDRTEEAMHEAQLQPSELMLVFDSPVSFETFVRILVPLDAAADAAAELADDPEQQQHVRACFVCEQLHSLDSAAAPFAAFPCSHAHVQAISHKARPTLSSYQYICWISGLSVTSYLHVWRDLSADLSSRRAAGACRKGVQAAVGQPAKPRRQDGCE